MGFIGTFTRFIVSVAIFVVVLALGIIFSPQLISFFGNLPGTVTIGNVEIPILASIVASLVLTVLINLIALPFRRNRGATAS